MFRFSFKKAVAAPFFLPRARLSCVRANEREGGESCKCEQSSRALKVYNLCNLSVEMNWVIYWKTQSQEDWISHSYPRAPIHQVPINNPTIEF